MLSAIPAPKQNHLLAALPPADYERLLPSLEMLPLPVGLGVYESGSPSSGVYFPIDCIISLVYVLANGISTEIAVIGNDGLVGIPLLMGGGTTSNRALVRTAGHAYWMNAAVLKKEMPNGGAFPALLLRYTQSLLIQIAQNAACTRHHSVEQRLCRWLLMSFDRMPSDHLATTHAEIASMLGVRREVVSTAAAELQKSGLIQYTRGHVTAVNRSKLEARVCECYAAVRRETDRLIQKESPDSAMRRRPVPPSRKAVSSSMYLSAQTPAWQYASMSGK